MSAPHWTTRTRENAGWLMVLGGLQAVLGLVVLSAPLAGGLAVTMLIGACLVIGGIARLVTAFAADSFGAGALAFVWGLLVATAGFYLFTNPGLGLVTLTIVISMMFFVTGITECVVAFHMRPSSGWGWMLAGGVMAVVLALLVWRQLPFSGIWLVGTLVGIQLLWTGLSTVMLGSAVRKTTAPA